MKTQIIRIDPAALDPAVLDAPAATLREGGLVAFPTETVYGIAVNLDRPEAVERLLAVRDSPRDKRLTLHVADAADAARRVPKIPVRARRLMNRFWPGPLTIVFPTADGTGLGVRNPNHAVARELLRRAGVPVGAPSANLGGRPPATNGSEVIAAFDGKLDAIIDAGPTRYAAASTIVRVDDAGFEVLREGAIPRSVVDELNFTRIVFVCTGNTCRSPMAEAIFKDLAARRLGVPIEKLEDAGLRIESAGTSGGGGTAFEHARTVMREEGLSLDRHVPKAVTAGLVDDGDHLFVMTREHRRWLVELVPSCEGRVQMVDPSGADVADPLFADVDVYRRCAAKLRSCLERRLAAMNLEARTT